jgi:hypothetical protein
VYYFQYFCTACYSVIQLSSHRFSSLSHIFTSAVAYRNPITIMNFIHTIYSSSLQETGIWRLLGEHIVTYLYLCLEQVLTAIQFVFRNGC